MPHEAGHRCRLCTANDDEALLEQVAADLWLSHGSSVDDRSWEAAGAYWQPIFRSLARAALRSMGRDVVVGNHVRFA